MDSISSYLIRGIFGSLHIVLDVVQSFSYAAHLNNLLIHFLGSGKPNLFCFCDLRAIFYNEREWIKKIEEQTIICVYMRSSCCRIFVTSIYGNAVSRFTLLQAFRKVKI